MTQEQKVIIDDKEYLLADLSEQAISQINNLKVTETEIARQESMLAMLKTARGAYARLLGEAMQEASVKSAATTKSKAKAAPASKAKIEAKNKVNGKAAAKPAAKVK